MPFDLAYDASTIFLTGVGTTTYDYDANGDMTTRGNLTLVWDAENHLTNFLDGSVNIATFIRSASLRTGSTTTRVCA